jgi:Ca2+-binding EF-hand superfamily protein
MTEQELYRDLKTFVGGAGMINISQVAKYLKVGRDTAKDKFLKQLLSKGDFIQTGKLDKKFFVKDVVKEILAVRGGNNS